MLRFCVGTRPEALKILPVLRELTARKMAFDVVQTGQHSDLMNGTGLKADYFLGLPSQNDPLTYVEECVKALQGFHVTPNVKMLVVQGDTASALAGARVGALLGLPVAHIEAGLRSGNLEDPWPEEGFRVEIDRLASLRFCPTFNNMANLDAEVPLEGTWVTGNTIIDALKFKKVTRTAGAHVLVTLHRRESFGAPFRDMLRGLAAAAKNHPHTPFCCPVHPNPEVRQAFREAQLPPNVILGGPLPYDDFLTFLSGARCVLTDSGGVVEEAAYLGVPTVIARNVTERPEAISFGTAKLVGKKALDIWEGIDWAMTAEVEASECFGDGTASPKIVDALTE